MNLPAKKLSLHLVSPIYKEEIVHLPLDQSADDVHSLHGMVAFPEATHPALVQYLVSRLSQKGDTILDPCCGSGTVGVEAILQGRSAVMIDKDGLAARFAAAKIFPCDLTEVTLSLQKLALRTPINVEVYRENFSSFFDIDTFREIYSLRSVLTRDSSRMGRYLEALTMSILHGHSAGFLSVYTFPQIALSPREQESLNIKRGQHPDTRQLAPRLLRKAAAVMRDGWSQSSRQLEGKSLIKVGDCRDIGYVASGSVQSVITALPLPLGSQFSNRQWLRLWFCGLDFSSFGDQDFSSQLASEEDLSSWLDFVSETLFELMRVTQSGGRIALILEELKTLVGVRRLDEDVRALIERSFARYLDAEATFVVQPRTAKIKDAQGVRDQNIVKRGTRILVLRRR